MFNFSQYCLSLFLFAATNFVLTVVCPLSFALGFFFFSYSFTKIKSAPCLSSFVGLRPGTWEAFLQQLLVAPPPFFATSGLDHLASSSILGVIGQNLFHLDLPGLKCDGDRKTLLQNSTCCRLFSNPQWSKVLPAGGITGRW